MKSRYQSLFLHFAKNMLVKSLIFPYNRKKYLETPFGKTFKNELNTNFLVKIS